MSMRKLLISLTALAALPAVAHAEGESAPKAPDILATVTLTAATDYVWRGFSQTNQNPALFAAVNLSGHGAYLGAETENVKFAGIRQEYDIWGGYVLPVGPVKLDVGFVRYGYVDAPANIDTLEGKVALSGNLGKMSAHVAGYYTGNYFGSHHHAEYVEVGASYPLLPKLSASGTVARQYVDKGNSYTNWNLGLSYALMKGVRLDLRYHDTNTKVFGDAGRSRLVGGFAVSF